MWGRIKDCAFIDTKKGICFSEFASLQTHNEAGWPSARHMTVEPLVFDDGTEKAKVKNGQSYSHVCFENQKVSMT